MIPDIKELNFPKKDGRQYATLTHATPKHDDMGEKTITTQVKIDGNIVPDFSFDWEVEFQGEKYIMPLRIPQGAKDNTSLNSTIDLTFQHWAIYQLKRWPFVTIQQIAAGTYLPDEEVATVSLNLGDFCILFGQVLEYYYGGAITIDLNPAWQYDNAATVITISHTKIWNVLIDAFLDKYGVRWEIKAASDNNNTVKGGEKYVIRVGYPTTEVDHIFEYGFEGGLLKVERQVQSDEIRNMLKGRGGDTNIPFRYFKDTDPNNPDFRPDPDWVEELANIYFTNLMPATFRSYVQGWKAAHISSYSGYTAVGESNAYAPWAYRKGYTDTKFAPVEFVADEITISPTTGDKQVEIMPGYSPYVKKGSSIDKYGPLPDTLDKNDKVYPTLQGTGLDLAVDVEQVKSDDVQESTGSDAQVRTLEREISAVEQVAKSERVNLVIRSRNFTVKQGKTANLVEGTKNIILTKDKKRIVRPVEHPWSPIVETFQVEAEDVNVTIENASLVVVDTATGTERSASGLPGGTYYFRLSLTVYNTANETYNVSVECPEPKLTTATLDEKKWANTFDIWVKNIWSSSKKSTESDKEYAERVWKPVLGDREGNTAKVMFTSGALAISEDYEFAIIGFPAYDTSKTYGGAQSHWRMTLAKSEAELEATGLYVPSTKKQGNAGDTFVFLGTEMMHNPYVTDAEKRLDDWKKDQLGEVKEIKPTAVVTTDRVRLNNEGKPNALINQLRVGNSVRLFDKRFFNEPGKAYETLYLQSITYTYREPSSEDAALNPNVEIVLGNEYATSANPVSMMQGEISALQNQVGSISNVEQIVRAVGDRLYLRKDGISDRSLSPTQFFSLLTSGDFRAGMVGGAGWGFFKDENGNWVLEADKINARQELQANSLVINQVEGRGGLIVESAAAMEVTRVEKTGSGYVCYFDQKGGSVANLFHLNDVAYCQRFTPDNGKLKYYRRKVTAVSTDSVTLSKVDVDGSGMPEEGDNIVHYGNYVDKTRQYIKVRDVVNGGYERYIEGLDSVSAKGTEFYFVGRQYGLYGGKPRWFIGERKTVTNEDGSITETGEYAEWINGKLNIKGSLSIGSTVGDLTLEEYIQQVSPPVKQEDIEDFVNNIVNPKIDGIQDQIDGVIETWFYNGVPTLTNFPANGWNTEALKIQHLGDLYYNNDTGTAYRFSKNVEGVYYWNAITDDAITKALAVAQQAQDTADGKRRVFIAQPTTQQEYDPGDLWVNATYGTQYSNDLLRCVTRKMKGAPFNIEHWTFATKYTDDTLANQVKQQVDELSGTVNNVSSTVNGLKNFTDTAFSDGIIDRSEASAIQTYLKNIETAQKEVQRAYASLDANTLLPTENKTALANAKAAFDSAANALVVKITEVIADGIATSEERAAVNASYTEFNIKYGDFVYALNQANAAIMGALNININKLGYLSAAMKELTTIKNGLILSSVVSLGKNNTDFTTQTTYSGISGLFDTSKRGNGIAAWYGGDMIDKFDYYNASTGDFNVPEGTRVAMALDRMDGTGYRANGNLWWDANGVVHADPLSFFVGESTVGALLASFQVVLQADGKHPDYLIPQVPFQSLTVASSIKIGNGYLKWDEANKAFYVEQANGAKANFYATGGVSAFGIGSVSGGGTGGSGGGLVESIYRWADLGGTFSDSANDTFNAYTINKIRADLMIADSALSKRVTSLEGGAAVNVTTTGSGNAITAIAKSGNVITATKGATFLTQHQSLANYVKKSGDTMTGNLSVPSISGISSTALVANLNADLLDGVHNGDLTAMLINYNNTGNVIYQVQFMQKSSGWNAWDAPTQNWYSVMKLNHGNGDTYFSRVLAFDFFSNRIYTHCKEDNTDKGWSTLAFLTDNVASATQLQTARTINGTSFNGTANITTENWGTARNIGIVNSDGTGTVVTVSVNGSENVNLKLPATIKAALSGNASTATKLATARTIWGQSFNGTENVSGAMTKITTASISQYINRTTYAGATWHNGYGALNVEIVDNSNQTPLLHAYRSGSGVSATGANRLFSLEFLNDGTSLRFQFGGVRGFTFSSSGVLSNSGISTGYISASETVTASSFYTAADSAGSKTELGKGFMELYGATPFINFHYNRSTSDYTNRIFEDASGRLSVTGNLRVKGSFYVGNQSTNAIEWDSANSAYKINGNLYATGGVSALGMKTISPGVVEVSSLVTKNVAFKNDNENLVAFGTLSTDIKIQRDTANKKLIIGNSASNSSVINFISKVSFGSSSCYIDTAGSAVFSSVKATQLTVNDAVFTVSGTDIYVKIGSTNYKLTKTSV